MFHLDNLHVMREMDSETVDLIATDPPFNKNRDFHANTGQDSLGGVFSRSLVVRRRRPPRVGEQTSRRLPDTNRRHPVRTESSQRRDGCLHVFQAVRLLEMRRILKPTGSIYLHCDPTASHYLKTIMDVIFGYKNFLNEIVWSYKTGGTSYKWFSRKHDVILFYKKTGEWKFNPQREKSYTRTLPEVYTASGKRLGVSRDDVCDVCETGNPGQKYRWVAMRDIWNDIGSLFRNHAERLEYPTQKPLALYERLILASTDEGDMVLDPFCGCATTCVAAERLNRQWVGIDIWEGAHEVVLERFEQEDLLRQGTHGSQMFPLGEFKYTTEPPVGEDDGVEAVPYLLPPDQRRRARYGWEKLSHSEIRSYLVESQKQVASGLVVCAGCGCKLETEFMELDHINPRASGGNNDISNRVLLCRPCNQRKKEKLTLPGLIGENKKTGWMENETEAKNALSKAIARLDGVKLDHP